MFNSPAPRATPRRGALRPRSTISRGTPSIYSEHEREPVTPSIRSSRLAVVQGHSPTSSAGETVRTIRNDDGVERLYWSRDERVAVTSAGQLPREVQALVKSLDPVTAPLSGHLDQVSGFAFISTSEGCIAWNYSKRTQSSPTCYAFPAPPVSSVQVPVQLPVISALYAESSAGEPGMILVSPSGELRFWESMSLALSNVERYQGVQLDLGADDYAERIWKVEGNTFLITTTSSLAFRLTITSHAGRLMPSIVPLTRPGGMFGRASAIIFGSREDREGIKAVTSEGGNVYILAGKMVQRWVIGPDSQKEQFVQEFDFHDAIGKALFEDRWSTGGITLELCDLVGLGQDKLAALVSNGEQESGSSSHRPAQNSHAIVVLSIHPRSGGLMVTRIIPVSYVARPDPRLLDTPRLLVPYGSAMTFIRFATDVVVASMIETSQYEDVISLKDTHRNAFISAGCLSTSSSSKRSQGSNLMLLPLHGGLMSVETFSPPLLPLTSETALATAMLKSKMEQAVFYGDRSDNPLSFKLPAGSQGDAAEAAETVSAEILSSSSKYMPAIFELRSALNDRLLRLKEIIAFIRKNGLLSKLPQSTRRRLSRDAEKAKAAIDLWDYQNRLMDQMHNRSPQSLLSDSILEYMNQVDRHEEDDLVRHFFRSQVQNLERILDIVFSTFRSSLSSADQRGDLSPWVLEVNRIFICVVRAASIYRANDLYDVDLEKPTVEAWTARDSIIDALEFLYSATERLIKDRTRDFGSVIDEPPSPSSGPELRRRQADQSLLKSQMTDLAAALCNNMEDKMRTASRRQLEDGADQQEGIALADRWEALKPRVIRPLVGIDRVEPAYELAEHHRDFPTLVWLCHDPIAGAGAARLQGYIEKFGEDFAFVLYQWYIDQGQLHALLNQDEVYGGLLTKFFHETDEDGKRRTRYPELSWIHDIACKRYGDAAEALLAVNDDTSDLAQKHLISSIGKLAGIVEVRSRGDAKLRKQLLVDLDDELDLINVQNNLRDSLLSITPTTRSTQSSLEAYVSINLSNLKRRPAFHQLFVTLAQQLVNGSALDIEGLVDVLTLKDIQAMEGGDAVVALDRLFKDTVLPEGRKQVALLSIWRRVFVRDDWAAIANTSGRSEEAQRQMLRRTSTYQTMRAINNLQDFPRKFILSPFTAAQSPLPAELAARFPDWPAADVEQLMQDHENEIEVLQRYIAEAGLEERVREVAELVRKDGNGGDGDVEM